MPELTAAERLQPSLLDRLTDAEPNNPREARERRVFSVQRLKECTLRDLAWLLNTTCMSQVENVAAYPHAAKSVINYGIPDLAGVPASSVNTIDLARLVREAIVAFEPRVLRNTLRVELKADEQAMGHNTLKMRIEADLWALPAPLRVLVNTHFDLESGRVALDERSRVF